jgi:hypothetical protein
MSKINQIEKALSEIDSAKFHKLINAYLSQAYSYRITSSGTKPGEDKSQKGTPDSYAILDSGKYVFIECTTQKEKIAKKFLEDLEKCLEEDKTGVKIQNIKKIILACNSDLKPNQVGTLTSKCNENNIKCEVLGLSSISNELFNKYPSIAKEFLDISIDTQQILDCENFIENYNSNKYSTPLHIDSLCREEEKKDLYQKIKTSSVVLITGVAGIGKTQLAIEVSSKYAKDKEYEFKIIFNRGTDIFNDMQAYFSEKGKKYLILIDDANRSQTILQYFLNYFGIEIEKKELKIVVTVRDYAKKQVIQHLPKSIDSINFKLEELSEESIKEIAKEKYDIHHSLYLERIAEIANGNPRLAIMACTIAKEKNTFESIYDVTALYDEYFLSIKNDLEILKNEYILKTIAIVAFFRHVDKNNKEQSQLIENAFNISMEKLWQSISKLNDLEIFDLYENEVVKVSDQILSTYLFYNIVFVDKKVSINLFLQNFFPEYQNKFQDTLTPILNTFNSQKIIEVLKEPVNAIWRQNTDNEECLYALMHAFWYFKQTDILAYFKKKIDNIDLEKVDLSNLDFWGKSNTNHIEGSILNQLSILKHDYSAQTTKASIELILKYFRKKPSILIEAIQVLVDSYGYQSKSYFYGYRKESLLFNTTWEYCKNGEDELCTKLFIRVCSELLRTEGKDIKFKNNLFSTQHFKIVTTDELKNIRKSIFEKLSLLYKNPIYEQEILKLIQNYPSNLGYMFDISDIEQGDAENILKFFEDNVKAHRYEDVRAIHKFLDFLEKQKIPFHSKFRKKFHHELYELEKIITLDDASISSEYPKDREERTDWDKIREIKKERLAKYIENYEFSDWGKLMSDCNWLVTQEIRKHNFKSNFQELFNLLSKKDDMLYAQVFEEYLKQGNTFNLYPFNRNIIDILGKEKSLSILKKYSYDLKEMWLFGYYQCLEKEEVEKNDVKELLKLYKTSDVSAISSPFNYLEKYFHIEPKIFILVTKILVDRCVKENEAFHMGFEMLFIQFNKTSLKIEEYFDNDIELIKSCYLLCMNKSQGFDYEGTLLSNILDYDISFFSEYLNKLFENKDYLSFYDINQRFDVLWKRDDCNRVFFDFIEAIFLKRKGKVCFQGDVLKAFLPIKQGNEHLDAKIITFLKSYIDKFCHDEARLIFIFEYIANSSKEIVIKMIVYFLQKNKSFELFDRLNLEPSSSIYSDSRVPYLQKNKDFYNSLLLNMTDLDFLQHRQKIEQIISHIEQNIEREKKNDFMRDF